MPNSGEDILRLAAVIDRQRQELDRARSSAAARSVIDMAKGALMERLGCSATDAASQLTALAAESGTPVAEIAAAIIGHDPVPCPAGRWHWGGWMPGPMGRDAGRMGRLGWRGTGWPGRLRNWRPTETRSRPPSWIRRWRLSAFPPSRCG